jgi:hypothetical protein
MFSAEISANADMSALSPCHSDIGQIFQLTFYSSTPNKKITCLFVFHTPFVGMTSADT